MTTFAIKGFYKDGTKFVFFTKSSSVRENRVTARGLNLRSKLVKIRTVGEVFYYLVIFTSYPKRFKNKKEGIVIQCLPEDKLSLALTHSKLILPKKTTKLKIKSIKRITENDALSIRFKNTKSNINRVMEELYWVKDEDIKRSIEGARREIFGLKPLKPRKIKRHTLLRKMPKPKKIKRNKLKPSKRIKRKKLR